MIRDRQLSTWDHQGHARGLSSKEVHRVTHTSDYTINACDFRLSQPTVSMLALLTLYSFVYSLHIQLTCVVENNNLMLSGS